MGLVQYQGVTEARNNNNAHFQLLGTSTSSGGNNHNLNRSPDLILKPYEEGIDFTIRLLSANCMAKVVELQLQQPSSDATTTNKQKKKHTVLTQDDIQQLFQAMGSKNQNDDDDDDDDDDDEEKVMDEYKPLDKDAKLQAGKGLIYMDSLSIVGDGASTSSSTTTTTCPSLINDLTHFLLSTHKFPHFTSLSLQSINLRGSCLELRALTEAFRMHPKLRRVQMTSCQFSPQQLQDDNAMAELRRVFRQQAQKSNNNGASLVFGSSTSTTNTAATANLRELVDKYQATNTPRQPQPQEEDPTNRTRISDWYFDPIMDDDNDDNTKKQDDLNLENLWWGERLFKSCFCWW